MERLRCLIVLNWWKWHIGKHLVLFKRKVLLQKKSQGDWSGILYLKLIFLAVQKDKFLSIRAGHKWLVISDFCRLELALSDMFVLLSLVISQNGEAPWDLSFLGHSLAETKQPASTFSLLPWLLGFSCFGGFSVGNSVSQKILNQTVLRFWNGKVLWERITAIPTHFLLITYISVVLMSEAIIFQNECLMEGEVMQKAGIKLM